MAVSTPVPSVLTDELIARCGDRAATYDRENRFFSEDFEELRQAGYLKMPIPREFGGLGMSLAEVCREQRRLAYRAPATALATNMHLYWMGVAADLHRLGDTSLRWMLEEGGAGEVFAAGHGEPGNDLPVMYSTAKAERGDGGYTFTGRKSFGSLSPVWTRLGIHAQDNSDPANPKIVHAFLPRDTPGYWIDETWDTVGMRATASHDTVLEGAFVPDKYIGRVVPTDFAGADLFVLALFVWVEPTFASVYLGLAQRAIDLSVEAVKTKTSLAQLTRTMAYHPEVRLADDLVDQHRVSRVDRAGPNVAVQPLKLAALEHRGTAVDVERTIDDLLRRLDGVVLRRNQLGRPEAAVVDAV